MEICLEIFIETTGWTPSFFIGTRLTTYDTQSVMEVIRFCKERGKVTNL